MHINQQPLLFLLQPDPSIHVLVVRGQYCSLGSWFHQWRHVCQNDQSQKPAAPESDPPTHCRVSGRGRVKFYMNELKTITEKQVVRLDIMKMSKRMNLEGKRLIENGAQVLALNFCLKLFFLVWQHVHLDVGVWSAPHVHGWKVLSLKDAHYELRGRKRSGLV